MKALKPLLEWLGAQKVIEAHRPVPAPYRPVDDLMDDYCRWMVRDRALAARTVVRYEATARRFLDGRAGREGGATGTEGLGGQAVTGFLLAEASRRPRSRLAPRPRGRTALAVEVPAPEGADPLRVGRVGAAGSGVEGGLRAETPHRRVSQGPGRQLRPDHADGNARLCEYWWCLPGSACGRRRSRGLELDALDWRAGELAVRGKARRSDRLPLPADVGEALSSYLVEARPRVDSRGVFVTAAVPPRPMWSTAVSQMVWRHCVRAGCPPCGPTASATPWPLNFSTAGVVSPEIAQVLRHRDLATTAVYAKVDHSALRELALPWPAVAR